MSWWSDFTTAVKDLWDFNPAGAADAAAGSWLSSEGGQIGSGLEAGFDAFLSDIWNVIIGPVEIITGVILALIILLWAFRDDLTSLAAIIGRGAA